MSHSCTDRLTDPRYLVSARRSGQHGAPSPCTPRSVCPRQPSLVPLPAETETRGPFIKPAITAEDANPFIVTSSHEASTSLFILSSGEDDEPPNVTARPVPLTLPILRPLSTIRQHSVDVASPALRAPWNNRHCSHHRLPSESLSLSLSLSSRSPSPTPATQIHNRDPVPNKPSSQAVASAASANLTRNKELVLNGPAGNRHRHAAHDV
jgi:hypothetical protein